ncbi:MAG: tetratricopeptide repeat protein [Pseudomonadota bacterium]
MTLSLLGAARAAETSGDAGRAVAIYESIVLASPSHVEALTRLGAMYAACSRGDDSIRAFAAVVRVRPTSPAAHYNLGRAHAAAGHHQSAIAAFERAAEQAPSASATYLAWAAELQARGNRHDALAVYARAEQAGCKDGALALCHGDCLHACGRLQQASARYADAARRRPDLAAQALFNAGACLAAIGEHAPAITAFDDALRARPDFVEALVNRGISRVALGATALALADYAAALALQPTLATAQRAAGIAQLTLGHWAEAIEHLQQALRSDADDAEAWEALGDAYRVRRAFLAAIDSYRNATAILDARGAPAAERAEVLHKQLDVLFCVSDFEGARRCAATLLAVLPDFPYAAGLQLYATTWTAAWDELEPLRSEVVAAASRGESASQPFPLLGFSDAPAAHRACAQSLIDRHLSAIQPLAPIVRKPRDRLTLAYLSPDFREHPVGQLIAATLAGHDRRRFKVIGLSSYAFPEPGGTHARLRAACDEFIDVSLLSDVDVAALLRQHEVDILVDLAAHTSGGRPGIAAYRAAPIQVNFLGYPGTYGANFIDYLIADNYVVPPSHEGWYVEKIARLPGSLVPPGDARAYSAALPSRHEQGLPDDAIVLCAFHNTYKILPEIYNVWLRLLAAQPRAVLWVSRHAPEAAQALLARAVNAGIEPSRIVFAARVASHSEHLARLSLADLLLDTFPYNAHSSAADALWAGVPVVTISGESFASRVCGGLLRALGLPELVTESLPLYEQTALTLLQDASALPALKRWLRAHAQENSIFNSDAYTRHLESAYELMWRRAEQGLPPCSFTLAADTAP